MRPNRVVRCTLSLLLLTGLYGIRPAHAQDAPAQPREARPGIAVLPFVNGGSFGPDRVDFAALELAMQQILTTELLQNSQLNIIERSALQKLLEEQDLVTSGRVDEATAAHIGKLLGAKYMVKGGFSDAYGTMRIDGHIVEVETGRIIRGVEVTDKREKLFPMLVELAARITRRLDLPALPQEQFEARRSLPVPFTAMELLGQARKLEQLGNTEEAVALYRRLLTEFPIMAEADVALKKLTGAS